MDRDRTLRLVHFCLVLVAGAMASTSACTSESGSDPGLTGACNPGASGPCMCGANPGANVCSPAGTWNACQCQSPSLATGDAAANAATDSGLPLTTVDTGITLPPTTTASGLPCDVAAVLQQHCASCHGAKTDFGAPMSLVTWDDLQKAAPRTPNRITRELALERIKSDSSPMPPAPHARVGADQIAAFEKWVTSGAPKSSQTCTPPASTGDAGALGMPLVPKPADCESTFEFKAHSGSSETDTSKFKISSTPALEGNQYHCFYFKPPYDAGSGLLWFDSILDNTARLHHWILYATDNAAHPNGSSAPCNAAEPGAYFVVGWAPGANNVAVPNDTALALPSGPNAQLILEVHYYNDSKKEQEDGSGVRICTAKQGQRTHTAGVHSVGSEGICIPPNARAHEVVGGCDPRDDMGDIHIVGVWPHMHKRARRQQVVIRRQGGTNEVIHDNAFDFNSQVFYPKSDIILHSGDTIEAHCFYDNDSNQQIKFGERTQDEMCYAFTMAWPAGALTNEGLFGGGAGSSVGINRCADDLSILDSCNGAADRPVTVDHPP